MGGVRVIFESTHRARKEYDCMACDYFTSFYCISDVDFSFSELRVLALARKNKGMIKKGDVYIRQSNVYEGERYTFTAIPKVHDLMIKHELYN